VHTDGTEVVYVDSDQYATFKTAELRATNPGLLTETILKSDISFPWMQALTNEAYTLDGWIRLVRLRPTLPCGLVALCNPTLDTLEHGTVTPLDREFTQDPAIPADTPAIRMASCLPHHDKATRKSSPEEMNMYDRPKRKTAKAAVKTMRQWTNAVTQEITTDSKVPTDLPCAVCGSPHDWDNLLLCHQCDKGCHTYCVGLVTVPSGEWYCETCVLHGAPGALPHPTFSGPSSIHPGSKNTPPANTPGTTTSGTKRAPSSSGDHTYSPSEGGDEAPLPDLGEEGAEITGAILEVWEDQATLQYLQTKQYDIDLLPDDDALLYKERRRIDKRAANYFWDTLTGKLFFRPTTNYMNREVPHPSARDALIDQMHLDLGHLGTNKLCSILLSRYYWRGIYAHVRSRLRNCTDCLRHKTLFKYQPELKPLPPSQLWERVSLDAMGPYAPTRNGCRFIFVAIDGMSKYVEAMPVSKQDADTMSRFFMYEVIARHGTPSQVITDGGKEFQFSFKDLMKELNIQHNITAAYNPHSNGQAEAAVKTILHGLQKAVGDNPHSWDDKLPLVLLGLRSAVHSTTKFSPFYINTGRNPVLPAERRAPPTAPMNSPITGGPMALAAAAAAAAGAGSSKVPPATTTGPVAADMSTEEEDLDELDKLLDAGTRRLMKQRSNHQDTVRKTLQDNILKSQAKQKTDFAKRHLGPAVQTAMPEGSLVLLWCPTKSKMSKVSNVEGPYRLIKYLSNSQALVQDATGKTWASAISRLAPYGSHKP
jgi:hypothetical protein